MLSQSCYSTVLRPGQRAEDVRSRTDETIIQDVLFTVYCSRGWRVTGSTPIVHVL